MNMTVTKKLVCGFGVVVVITAGLGFFGTIKMRSVAVNADSTATEYLPAASFVEDITVTLGGMRQNGQLYMVTGNPDAWKKYEDGRAAVRELLTKAMKLTAEHGDLAFLRAGLDRVATLAGECSAAMEQTRVTHGSMDKAIAKTHDTGPILTQGLAAFIDSEYEKLDSAEGRKNAIATLKSAEIAQRAIADIRLANFKAQAALDAGPLAGTGEAFAKASDAFNAIAATSPAASAAISPLIQPLKDYQVAIESMQADLPVLSATMAKRTQVVSDVSDVLQTLGHDAMNGTSVRAHETLMTASSSGTLLSVGSILGTLLAIALAWLISRSVTKPILVVTQMLSIGADQTAGAASQVSEASQSLAQGASEQAASLEETSASIEEMSSMIKKNADTSQQASALSGDAKDASDRGSVAMEKMNTAIVDIERAAGETAKIIKVIDEIAFQTNLLALNAAVEAARAGEAGKGFAVVAEEVRNLAMRSAEAAKNTSRLIEESVGKAKNGVSIAETVAKNLQQINESTTRVSGLIAEIAAASKEQATGIDQISAAVGQMDKVTQTNAANAEESAAASEELNAQAEQLKGCVRDLQKLVGATASTSTDVADSAQVTPVGGHGVVSLHPATSARRLGTKPKGRELIPLEPTSTGDGFSDFSKAA